MMIVLGRLAFIIGMILSVMVLGFAGANYSEGDRTPTTAIQIGISAATFILSLIGLWVMVHIKVL